MVQKKSQKVKRIEKKCLDLSNGQIEVAILDKSKTEASKYCEENDGMLNPLHNQEIVDKVPDKLQDVKIVKNKCWFHVGLDCKNGIYQWQVGMKLNGNSYDPSLQLPTDICQNLCLYRKDRSKKFQIIASCYDCCYSHPFLCLRNNKTKSTRKSSTTTFAETTIQGSGNNQITTFTTNSNKEVSNNSLLIGLSVGLVLLFAIICFIILKKIFRKREKNKRSTTENIELNNASNNEVVDDVSDNQVDEHEERINIIYNLDEDVIYSMADDDY